jgi:hypothetical protein
MSAFLFKTNINYYIEKDKNETIYQLNLSIGKQLRLEISVENCFFSEKSNVPNLKLEHESAYAVLS